MTAVVGLDLSLTATGIALPDGTVQTIGSKGKATADLRQRAARLCGLFDQITDVIGRAGNPLLGDTLVVVEGPAFSRTTGHQHDRSGLWWLVVAALDDDTFTHVVEVQPTSRAKYATGKGNAGKDEVLAAVVRRYPDVEVTNNNEADALVLRAMGCDWLGQPLVTVPQVNRAALDKVAWPTQQDAA